MGRMQDSSVIDTAWSGSSCGNIFTHNEVCVGFLFQQQDISGQNLWLLVNVRRLSKGKFAAVGIISLNPKTFESNWHNLHQKCSQSGQINKYLNQTAAVREIFQHFTVYTPAYLETLQIKLCWIRCELLVFAEVRDHSRPQVAEIHKYLF